ncbi:HNH endonuclease family protein [Streptomyces solisilvae]|uniref:HNH endonuclease family protein n=1 Tax=Streptomyces malaysiensis TaxID=92644 RepID=UPI0036C92FA5
MVTLLLAAAFTGPAAKPAAADDGGVYEITLRTAVASLPVAEENNDGYKRTSFRHWIDADHDGCPTRSEVLQEESDAAVTNGPGCRITGGKWLSYYDGKEITDPGKLDIDHVVPLKEGWGSGAYAWTPERRQAYANDLDDPRALAAVSAAQNRAKADKDPAEWLPADEGVHCRYIGEWTAIKLRWGLAADAREYSALNRLAASCPDKPLKVIPAPVEESGSAPAV